jgi:UDP-N-acetylglucosamine 2-epimerase (non-hydrolysing)
VKLLGTNKAKLAIEVTQLIEDKNYYLSMSQAHNPYGVGFAAARIVKIPQSRI